MFDAIKRWMSGDPPSPGWVGVSEWAASQGYGFKRARDDEGFVIDGSFGQQPWRLEWGPPQRSYITTQELRIRMALKLPSDMQMLLMSQPLMEMLERETFERYTQTTQTLIDVSTPEEMRWLAMFPKVTLALPKDVRGRFGAVGIDPQSTAAWVDAATAERLAQASHALLRDEPPFVLMTLRGRVYLRLQLAVPEPAVLAQAVALFDAAAQSALRLADARRDRPGDAPSTGITAWQAQLDDSPDSEH